METARFLWMHQCAWFSSSHYTRLSRLFPFPKSKTRTYNIYFALFLSQLSNECASLAFLVQQYLANSVSKISLRIWYLVFFVETNTIITFDKFLCLLLKLRCLMSQMYLLHRIHTNHKETRDVLDGGSECPITAFCFWSHLCQKRCSNKSFCQQSINTQ